MKLEQVIFALTMRAEAQERPKELARYAFMEWLGRLDGNKSFAEQAMRARRRLNGLTQPALIEFRMLLDRAIDDPFEILPLSMPKPARRGGRKRIGI